MENNGKYVGWLLLEYVNGSKWYVRNDPDRGDFGFLLSDGRLIDIPDGFPTDFASIPVILWPLFPPVGKGARSAYGKAAVIHDYLYAIQEVEEMEITRKGADDIFLQCLEASDVSKWRRYLMWAAVRLFGWFGWKGILNGKNNELKRSYILRATNRSN